MTHEEFLETLSMSNLYGQAGPSHMPGEVLQDFLEFNDVEAI